MRGAVARVDGLSSQQTQTFEPTRHERRTKRSLVRLTGAEAAPIRYVLSEWSGEAGLGSNMSAQLEKLAAAPHLVERLRRSERRERAKAERPKRRTKAAQLLAIVMGTDGPEGVMPVDRPSSTRLREVTLEKLPRWHQEWLKDQQTIFVHSVQPSSVDHVWPQEAWTDRSSANERFVRRHRSDVVERKLTCERILACWRSLCRMAEVHDRSLVTLNAFYGERPSGLLEEQPFKKAFGPDLGVEYLRVMRLASGRNWDGRELETRMRNGGKMHLPEDFAERCEVVIIEATQSYRFAAARE